VLPIEHVAFKLAVGNFKKKLDEINPLSKFLSPLVSFVCSEDTISVPGIVCGTIWGSFPVLGPDYMSRAGPVSRAASVSRDDFQPGIT